MARRVNPFAMHVEADQFRYRVDRGGPPRTDQFVLQVRGDRLHAHWRGSGVYDSPPRLDARIEQRPDGLMITGTVRESFNDALWQPAYLGLTIFMALLAVFGVVTLITGYASGGLPPLLIGVIATPAFFLIWRRAKRNRQPNFDEHVRNLNEGMQEAFSMGSANRFTR